ncbi:MAG: AAA family ATPase, partial [Phascolarctobacterium sp.]|nr:AAA family ATPase [Phascolarctobacterium sp.]
MHSLTSQLLIYKNIASDSILCVLAEICRRFKEGNYDREKLVADIYTEIHRLLDLSTSYGFNKNLWHNYLAFLLAMTENPFTLVSEKTGAHAGTVNEFARQDFMIFKNLFDYDFSAMEKELGISCFSLISNYQAIGKSEHI